MKRVGSRLKWGYAGLKRETDEIRGGKSGRGHCQDSIYGERLVYRGKAYDLMEANTFALITLSPMADGV